MGFDTLSWAWKQSTKAKLVLIALAESANDETGECWPGVKFIAKRCGISVRSVQRDLRILKSESLIHAEPHFDSQGRQSSNTYQICLPGIPIMSTRGDASVTGRVTPVSPLEPELEPSGKYSPSENTYMCVACGQFKNVVLTESQKEKLAVQFGVAGMDQRIEALSEYMAAKGKKYRDHYAVILTWERKNGRGQQSHKTKDDRTAEAQARLIARMYPENGGSRER